MAKTDTMHSRLRMLPGVDHILEISQTGPFYRTIPKSVLVRAIRSVIETLRTDILSGQKDSPQNPSASPRSSGASGQPPRQMSAPKLAPLINATGVVIHTNLGRSLLCEKAMRADGRHRPPLLQPGIRS